MTFRDGVQQTLLPAILFEALFDFGVRGLRSLQIAFIHDHDVGQVEHDDLLQLQTAPVIRVHHQHRLIDNSIFLKRHRFLTGADSFDDDIIESRPREQREAVVRCGR